MILASGWIIERRRRLALVFLTLAVAYLAPAASAKATPFAPANEHFSIELPGQPARKDTEAAGTKIREWTAQNNGFFYLLQHGVHPGTIFQKPQLQADLKDFVDGTKCTITAQESTTWPGPDGPLPALRFSFKMPSGAPGEGIWLITGDEAFGAIVLDTTKAGRRPPMESFIKSLRIVK